jgi:hypothetical protein
VSERDRFALAVEAIDRANGEDPDVVEVRGRRGPKEVVHAELMTDWVRRLDPGADEAQLLAARAHHFRRWTTPRAEYPAGRSGYLRWRTAARRRHAQEVAELLAEVGYDPAEIDEVTRIVRKEGLRDDPRVQTHEDALCLVFLEAQLGAVARQLGEDQTVDVLSRTMAKMSETGRAAALGLDLGDDDRRLVLLAADRWAGTRRTGGPDDPDGAVGAGDHAR